MLADPGSETPFVAGDSTGDASSLISCDSWTSLQNSHRSTGAEFQSAET
jgi:hypothetical protein